MLVAVRARLRRITASRGAFVHFVFIHAAFAALMVLVGVELLIAESSSSSLDAGRIVLAILVLLVGLLVGGATAFAVVRRIGRRARGDNI